MRYARFLPVRDVGPEREAARPEGADGARTASPTRHRLLRAMVCAALAAGLLLSPNLWLTRDAPFPMTPAWEACGSSHPPPPGTCWCCS